MSARMRVLAALGACACAFACASPPVDGDLDAAPSDAMSDPDAAVYDAASIDGAPHDARDGASREGCDEEGEVCCPDMTCARGLPCVDGLCGFATCGELGEPCCAASTCGALGGLVCEDGICVEPSCGSVGHACCAEGTACRDERVCHEGTCRRCGRIGEECCPGELCEGELHCASERGPPGQCVAEAPACGGSEEACCTTGDACAPGLGCVSGPPGSSGGACRAGPACGADRRVCCDTEPRCGAALLCVSEWDGVDRCQRCGAFGLACCDGAVPCGPELTCIETLCVLPP